MYKIIHASHQSMRRVVFAFAVLERPFLLLSLTAWQVGSALLRLDLQQEARTDLHGVVARPGGRRSPDPDRQAYALETVSILCSGHGLGRFG